MSAKLMITDWRGAGTNNDWNNTPAGIVAARAALNPSLVSVSTRFTAKPISGVTTLVGFQSALGSFNGNAPGTFAEDPASYTIFTEGRALGYDLLPMYVGGRIVMDRLRTYPEAGTTYGVGTETYALNFTRAKVCRWFAAIWAANYLWADGWHNDYWTSLAWLLPHSSEAHPENTYTGVAGADGSAESNAFWDAYMLGLNRTAHEIRRLRALQGKTTFILGDHQDNMAGVEMRELNGRMVEHWPQKWKTMAAHQTDFSAFPALTLAHQGAIPSMAIELDFATYPQITIPIRDEAMTFARANSCFVSWGRDANAGVISTGSAAGGWVP